MCELLRLREMLAHEYVTSDYRVAQPYDDVYDDRFAGEDTRSQLNLGGGGGERAATMAFDSVYDSRFAGEDTRSQLTAAHFGGGGGSELAAMPHGLAVFSHAHAGKTSRSSIVFGTYHEPTPPRRRDGGVLSGRRREGGVRAALPPMSGRSGAVAPPAARIQFDAGGMDTRSSAQLSGPAASVARVPEQQRGGHAYPLPSGAGPVPSMSPLIRARAVPQYGRAELEGSYGTVTSYPPSPSDGPSRRERALEERVSQLEEKMQYLLALIAPPGDARNNV